MCAPTSQLDPGTTNDDTGIAPTCFTDRQPQPIPRVAIIFRRLLVFAARVPGATPWAMTDDELADAWEAGTRFPGGISDLDHVRIAWVLHRRHDPQEATARLLRVTQQACVAHGCPEKSDPALTARWARAIADRPFRLVLAGAAGSAARSPGRCLALSSWASG